MLMEEIANSDLDAEFKASLIGLLYELDSLFESALPEEEEEKEED